MPKTLNELINTENPSWTILKEWIALAKNKVEILPVNIEKAEEALVQAQVSTRSLMGAIIYETGGLLIENGWIRILGSGCDKMKRSLPAWNKGKTFSEYGEIPPYLLVADDATGGIFAINGGYLGEDRGKIYYNSPNSLEWQTLDIEYSQFLLFCFENDLNEFYQELRWNGWKNDILNLDPDYCYIFSPLLWTKEGSDINQVERKTVSMEEGYNFNMEMKTTLRK